MLNKLKALGWRPVLASAVLVAGVGWQIPILYRTFLKPRIERSLQEMGEPVWERTAIELEGQRFADYMGFVRSHTPEDSSIVLPPHSEQALYFEHIGFMQFFLYPRKVYNCGPNEAAACMYRARSGHTYVLGLKDFPPSEEALKYKDYIPFDDTWGLYVPKPGSPD